MPEPVVVRVRDAAELGFSRQMLRGARWEQPFSGVRTSASDAGDLRARCRAILAVAPPCAAISGLMAAQLRGWWLPDPFAAALTDVTVGPDQRMRRRNVRSRRSVLSCTEQEVFAGIPTTSAARTLLDLAADYPLIDLVVLADSALSKRHCGLDDLHELATKQGLRGIGLFRRMVELVEPASESPMESLLRLVVVLSGLPRPLAQVEIRGALDEFVARADLTSPDGRSVFEYDGQEHNTPSRHATDVRRWRALREAGFEVYPYTAIDVLQRPQLIVGDYQRALGLAEDPEAVRGWLREWRLSASPASVHPGWLREGASGWPIARKANHSWPLGERTAGQRSRR